MVFRDRNGTRVDPVPFLVTTLLLALIVLSWGPGYLLAFGFALPTAIGICAATTAALSAGAYHRLVWTPTPEYRDLLSPGDRLKHLAYLALAGALLIVLLAIPLYAQA
jgi:hypothetical protein